MAEEGFVPVENGLVPDEYFVQFMDRDKATEEWILWRSPIPVMTTLGLYLFVLWLGPRLMKDRAPYQLTTVMRVYDLVQIFTNLSIFIPIIIWSRYMGYVIRMSCGMPKESDEKIDELRQVYVFVSWLYVMNKILDLLDTVFMILRKANSRITFLHVYHHAAMVFFSWFSMKYIMAPQAVVPGLINTAVHIIMYSYYFLATFGPQMEKYLWWKRHLTKLQLAQFAVVLVYFLALKYYHCPISQLFTYIWVFNVFVILCLFINFYVKAYLIKPKGLEVKDENIQEPKKQKGV